MSSLNDKLIKQSFKAFRSQLETVETKELLEIIKNYKLLLSQLDAYNGALLRDLMDIAEKKLKTEKASIQEGLW